MKKYWFGLAILLMSIIVTFISYPYLPDRIAVHWNYKGAPDDYDHKSFGLFLLPGIMIVLYLLTSVLPKIDPKKSNFQRFQGPYFQIMNGILLFLFLIQVVQITSGLGIVNPKYVVPELVGLLFIFIGNLIPNSNLIISLETEHHGP